MSYEFLADIVVLLHLGFVLFVVAGGLLVWRRRWVAWIHLPAVLWGISVEWAGLICPLTPLELLLRQWGGGRGGSAEFVGHYLLPFLYPQGLTRTAQIILGGCVLAINALVYACLVQKHRRDR